MLCSRPTSGRFSSIAFVPWPLARHASRWYSALASNGECKERCSLSFFFSLSASYQFIMLFVLFKPSGVADWRRGWTGQVPKRRNKRRSYEEARKPWVVLWVCANFYDRTRLLMTMDGRPGTWIAMQVFPVFAIRTPYLSINILYDI